MANPRQVGTQAKFTYSTSNTVLLVMMGVVIPAQPARGSSASVTNRVRAHISSSGIPALGGVVTPAPAITAVGDDIVILLQHALHAGRADGHTGHGQSRYLRPVAQHALHQVGRHVPLHDVATNQGGVTGDQVVADAGIGFPAVQLDQVLIVCYHREPVLLHVLDPVLAAATAGGHVNHQGVTDWNRISGECQILLLALATGVATGARGEREQSGSGGGAGGGR